MRELSMIKDAERRESRESRWATFTNIKIIIKTISSRAILKRFVECARDVSGHGRQRIRDLGGLLLSRRPLYYFDLPLTGVHTLT